jgi:hypothetical protein
MLLHRYLSGQGLSRHVFRRSIRSPHPRLAPLSLELTATVAGKGGGKAAYALASTKDCVWK